MSTKIFSELKTASDGKLVPFPSEAVFHSFVLLILFAAHLKTVLVFFFGGQAAPYMALGFVNIQDHPGSGCQGRIDVFQSVRNIFMYRRFGYPKFLRGLPHGCMKRIGIQGAYISTALTEGIEPEDFVEPELKAKMLTSIRDVFDQSLKKFTFQSSKQVYVEIAKVAESVVMNVLNKDKYLFQLIDIRDYDGYTYSHSLYVGILSVLLGKYIGLSISNLNDLALCGLLHDIGKTDISIDITNKPGPLTSEEFEIMRDAIRSVHNHMENCVEHLCS